MPAVPAPVPRDEAARLTALHELQVLDTLPEAVYDDIVRLAAQICGTPIAQVSLIDRERQWSKASVGLPLGEARRDLTFCTHAIVAGEPVFVVEDTALDARFQGNPFVTGRPHVRFYAGAPIVMPEGRALGTVCVVDIVPRTLDAAQLLALQALSRQTTALLELRLRTLASERASRELARASAQATGERRRSAALLELSEHRLSLALSRSGLAVFDWDVVADRVYHGANFSVMRGGPAVDQVCTITEVQSCMHPADVLAVREAIRVAVQGTTDGYDFEHRVRRLDGRWVWVHAVGRVTERGPDGRALRLSGTDEDVSSTKAVEQALIDSERRLRMVTDHLPALIAHIDAEQRYRFLNAHIHRVFGTDVEASIGRTMRETRGEVIYAQLAPHVEAALRGELTRFTYTEEVAGRSVHYQSNYIPDVDAAGHVHGFYAMTFDVTEQHETQRQLELLARVDTLTGLPNRRQFDERIADALLRARRIKQTLAVMFLDIDHFKQINDSIGHAGGDAVLCEFARRLRACVRATDVVARLAGDEFVVLLEGVAGPAELAALADKVVASVRAPFEAEGTVLAVTTSVGVATCSDAQASAAELLARADGALYRAKSQGRNGHVIV